MRRKTDERILSAPTRWRMKLTFREANADRRALKKVINRLGSRNAVVRAEAEDAVRNLSSELVDELVAISREEADAIPRRSLTWFGIAPCGLLFATYAAAAYYGAPVPKLCLSAILLIVSLLVALVPILFWSMFRPRFQTRLRLALSLVDDPRLLGPLLLRITRWHGELAPVAVLPSISRRLADSRTDALISALTRVTARVSSDDDVDLTPFERGSLQAALYNPDIRLVLALLHVLEQSGGSQDLLHVRRLAAGTGAARTNPAVRTAALRCLAVIEAQLAENRNIHTLLRASQPSASEATLLRPASGVAPVAPEQLLRAAGPTNEGERSRDE